jgi:hypothetical protein
VSAEWTREQQAQGGGTSLVSAATAVALHIRNLWPYLAEGMRQYRADPTRTTFLNFVAHPGQRTDRTNGWVYDAIVCNEGQLGLDPTALAATLFDGLSGADHNETSAEGIRAGVTCAGWPPSVVRVRPDGGTLATRPLVLQSDRDPATPAAGGPAVAAAMHGSLIRVGGGDHVVFGRGNPQLDAAVLGYLETGEVTMTRAAEPAISSPNPPTALPPAGTFL